MNRDMKNIEDVSKKIKENKEMIRMRREIKLVFGKFEIGERKYKYEVTNKFIRIKYSDKKVVLKVSLRIHKALDQIRDKVIKSLYQRALRYQEIYNIKPDLSMSINCSLFYSSKL